MSLVVRAIQFIIPNLISGPIPAIARGGFNMAMLGVGLMISGYFSNVDKSIQFLSTSVNQLNGKMTVVVEQSEGQKKVQDLHSSILQNMDRRLQRLEEKIKGDPK